MELKMEYEMETGSFQGKSVPYEVDLVLSLSIRLRQSGQSREVDHVFCLPPKPPMPKPHFF